MKGRGGRWQQPLVRHLDDLGRWFEGRLMLAPDPGDEVTPAERFLDGACLREAIAACRLGDAGWVGPDRPGPDHSAGSRADHGADLRIFASRFTRLYTSVISGAALTALAHGAGLDVSPERCRIVQRGDIPVGVLLDIPDDHVVRCAQRPTSLPVSGPVLETLDELRRYVWRALYGQHIGPLFARVAQEVNVSPNLLWSNAAEWPGMLLDAAMEYLEPGAARPFVADCVAVLEADTLPAVPGSNPLRGHLDWVPFDGDGGFPRSVQTRRMCCLTYYLSDRRGRLCQNCPYLPIEERVALIRERHGLSQSDPRGPAEQRSIEHGMARLARRG